MFMNIACPMCGHSCRVSERMLGQQIVCPACSVSFQCGTVSPPSLKAQPSASEKSSSVQEMPQARPAAVEPQPSIHYRCARCQKPLESPARLAGHKINCPDCGQRLKIPAASTAPPPPDNKTILATEEPPRVAEVPVRAAAPRPAAGEEPILTVLPASPPAPAAAARREYCLECGVEVTQRPRIQTCPDCGSLFCSARCYRDHCYHAHPRRRR